MGDSGAVESLITTLKKEEISGIQWKAAEALGKIGKPAMEPLILALVDKYENVRAEAEHRLPQSGLLQLHH
jgi:HEAT repeat protein